ncbi:tetratricopeptide repeat protein [Lentzea sp. NPDC006480]|uniref:ATP-binding protein n=1 Tax=Lentzea sp. NPDC006480 TaxID=3157176 RepID=UPI0033BF3F2C
MDSRRQKTDVQTTEPTFHGLLEQLLIERRLSLADAGVAASVSKSHVGNLVRGLRRPSPEIAQALDRALGADGRLAALAVPKPRAHATRERVRPAQLPGALCGFAPRRELLEKANAALSAHEGVIAFDGPAGVGKTTFAVNWARMIAAEFPDGVLFTDLRGYAPDPPEDPAIVLGRFLHALGAAPSDIPTDLEGRVALYRTLLQDTRTLIVLDNAENADQIRPLLPSSPKSLALITSRNRLSGAVVHHGAVRITLQPMTCAEAHDLLRRLVGPRVDDEPDAARVIAQRAGRLPLALRIAGERASLLPTVPLRKFADELTRHRPLDVLTADETAAVRTVLSWSHDALPHQLAVTFRLLGLHPGGPISIEAAAVLTGRTPLQAQGQLSALAAVHLVEQTAQDRFVMHDLVHAYALEQVREHNTQEVNTAALTSLVDSYLATGAAATRMLWPGRTRRPLDRPHGQLTTTPFHEPADAVQWFENELQLLVSLVRTGARWNITSVAYLPVVVNEMIFHRRAWSWWVPALRDALRMARQGAHRDAEAWVLETLGDAGMDESDASASLGYYRQALQIRTELSDHSGMAACHVGLGRAHHQLGRIDTALAHLETACQLGDPWEFAVATAYLGIITAAAGDLATARTLLLTALNIFDEAEDKMNACCASTVLAGFAESAGDLDLALLHLEDALRTYTSVADRWSQAHIHSRIGDLHNRRSHHHAAHQAWTAAAELLSSNAEPTAAGLRQQLMDNLKEDR